MVTSGVVGDTCVSTTKWTFPKRYHGNKTKREKVPLISTIGVYSPTLGERSVTMVTSGVVGDTCVSTTKWTFPKRYHGNKTKREKVPLISTIGVYSPTLGERSVTMVTSGVVGDTCVSTTKWTFPKRYHGNKTKREKVPLISTIGVYSLNLGYI